MAILLTLTSVFVVLALWVGWKLFSGFFTKTDLDNVPGPPPTSFVAGNLGQIFNLDGWAFHDHIAKTYGSTIRIKGLFSKNILYISDAKALHHILVKDQDIFEETADFIITNRMIFGEGLLASLGANHRRQRKMLNPLFSIVHMRHMTPIFYSVSRRLSSAIAQRIKDGEVDVCHWMTRTALELVGQSGLGYSFDSLAGDVEAHPYAKSIKQLVPTLFQTIFSRTLLLPIFINVGSPEFRRWVVDRLPWKNIRKLKDIINVMHSTSVSILEGKRKALEEGNEAVAQQIGQGKDIMSILMRANMEAAVEDRLGEEEVLGQMSTLIFAAMDTTSNALSRILDILANHPEAQDKLRLEILEARQQHGKEIPYDKLVALPYLDAVCRETLRVYPPVAGVLREARRAAILPLSTPVKGVDGREMHEILVPKGTKVIISIAGSNRNLALWGPDGLEWKPERWTASLPEAVINAPIPGVYSHLMTFLGGGRACIGFKFSQLEMKVVLAALLSKFRFSPSDKEIVWEMSGIAIPTVKGYSKQPSLPMKVELYSQ